MPDRYEIKGKIARGGIGAIYRAFDTVMGREVAIKRLLPLEETHLNEAQDDSLKREAAALARFQHPNIVTIYAFESDSDGPYVVMELVEGETLKEAVERAALPVEDFAELAQQLLDPLVAARELNLLHRDIKPANIMLTWLASGRFQVKVLDFGLAKFSQQPSLQTLDQTGSFLGSIDYLAPEQLELHPLDQRTDLYSLGCVLYFALAQRPPFEGDNAARTMQNHLSHRVTPLGEIRDDVPAAIAGWVMRLISRQPADRPADALAALREFEKALRGESLDEPEAIPVAILLPDDPEPAPAMVAEPAKPRTAPQVRPRTTPHVPATPRKGSAPVLARPAVTGSSPVKGTASKSQTDRVNRTQAKNGSAPMKRPEGGEAGAPWWREHPLASSLAAVALVGLAAVIFGRGGESDSKEAPGKKASPPPATAAPATKTATPPAAPPLPVLTNSVVTQPVGGVPVVTGGLVAHYAASDAVMGGDFTRAAAVGDKVGLWGNLAPGAAKGHLLAVEAQHRDKGPKLVEISPEEWPELAKPVRLLRFDRSTRLIAHGGEGIAKAMQGAALTTFLVIRPDRERGPVLRLDSDQASPFLAWDMTPAGYSTRLAKGTLAPTIESRLGGHRNRLIVLCHVWDGEKVEQRHHLMLPDGHEALIAAGDAPFKPETVKRYSIGAISSDPQANTFEGWVAEWLIYDRALPDDERRRVAAWLSGKYLSPDRTLTIDSVTPQPNGAIPPVRNPDAASRGPVPPAPPGAAVLAAHYAAGAGMRGYDLLAPVRPGQRVMAWANLAPGAAGDHLLAYQGGKEPLAPIWPGDGAGALRFETGGTLEARGAAAIQGKLDDRELTAYIALGKVSGSGALLEFKAASANPALALEWREGTLSAVIASGGARQTAALPMPDGKAPQIAGLIWRAGDGKLILRALAEGSTEPLEASVASPVASLPIDGYRIGRSDGDFSGDVAALLIYGKALDDATRKQVESHLATLPTGR
ncbi:MAG: serine/threonine protein kinase [Verrucomicrobiales bacterium]|nr:serine/threonine protein kinase [Verrucomicrobiales bacterium]